MEKRAKRKREEGKRDRNRGNRKGDGQERGR